MDRRSRSETNVDQGQTSDGRRKRSALDGNHSRRVRVALSGRQPCRHSAQESRASVDAPHGTTTRGDSAMNKTYRAVIIGDNEHGAFGHYLDRAFDLVPRVEVCAVADPVEAGLKRSLERSKAQRGYTDYRQMLKKERAELAVIAPRFCDRRKEMVLACVEAGVKGIYLEKPIAASVADADAMVEAGDRADVRVVVDHWRAGGDVRKAKE